MENAETETEAPDVGFKRVTMKKPPVAEWRKYAKGTPGAARREKRITLTEIKKNIAANGRGYRAHYRAEGLLA